MCGTFSQNKDGRLVIDSWAQNDSDELRRKPLKYISREERIASREVEAVYPSQNALILLNTLKNEVRLQEVKWGLIPTWAAEPFKSKNQHFNARSETAMNLATFKESYQKWRCLVPMAGYFEYKRSDEQLRSTKYFISSTEKVMWVAGLFSFRKQDEVSLSFSILTEEPRAELALIHHRKPCILNSLDEGVKWLNGASTLGLTMKKESNLRVEVFEKEQKQLSLNI